MFRKNRLLWMLALAALLLILFVVVGKKKGWIGNSLAEKVAVEKVSKHDIVEEVSASGKIYPKVEVKLSPDVSGEITELNVQEGDTIKQGDVLMKIKPDIYQAQLDRAVAGMNTAKANFLQTKSALVQVQAEYDKAEKTYNRNKELHDKKVIADADWEVIESGYKGAKASLDGAQMNVQASDYNVQSAEASVKEFQEDLRKTTIYAPMNGVVTGLYVEKGERVLGTTQMEGTDMMHIADLNAIEARVDVSENDVLRVKVGDTSVIKLDAYPDQKFKGVVTQIANSAKGSGGAAALTASDQVTNFVVKILLLPDSYAELMKTGSKRPPFLSGMSASVDIMTNTMHNIIAVPITSVTTRADTAKKDPTTKKKSNEDKQEIVFVPENGKVKAVKVVTGIEDDEYIEIKSGLNGDEQVVSAPYKAISTTLKDGSMIEVVSKDELFKEESK